MKFVFRTDASHQIGTGHVMRCLTLACALKERGAECEFICREHPGHLLELIRDKGFKATALPYLSDARALSDRIETPALAHADWLGTDWATDADATRNTLAK